MHILFLTDNFPPESNAPASRTFEHCREWVRAGHQVTVITCAPNFPKGKVFDGYRNRLWQQEVMAGMRVIRVWSYITANEGFVKRILDYQSFMLSATLAAPFVRSVDVVVGTSPQFFTDSRYLPRCLPRQGNPANSGCPQSTRLSDRRQTLLCRAAVCCSPSGCIG